MKFTLEASPSLSPVFGGLARLWSRFRGAKPEAYEGGRVRRTDPDFTPVTIGPNALADQTLDLVRRRSRWLGDNHPLISGAKSTLIHNTAGESGIMVRAATRWPELNKVLKDLWYELEEGVDPAREQSVRDSQAVFIGECFDGGDVLCHFPMVEAFRGAPAGPALELLPAEQLELSLNSTGRQVGSNVVRQGVEFDALKRRVAYHVYLEHPSDGWLSAAAMRTRRLAATEARLCFPLRRPGQVRGVPMIVAAIQTARTEDAYQDGFLQMALAAACIGLYFEGVPADKLLLKSLQESGVIDAYGNPVKRMEPGMIGFMQKGMSPHLMTPNVPPPNFNDVSALLARRMGASSGMGYADFTRDEGQTTFSAARAEALKSRKLYRTVQMFVFQQHTAPLYRAMVTHAVASGRVKLTPEQQAAWLATPRALLACQPIFPGWEWVNPQQEAQAAEIGLRIGVASLPDLCAQQGRHFEDVIDEQCEAELYEERKRAELGLKPRPAAPVGGQQPGQQPQKDDDDEGGKEEKKPRGGRLAALNGNGVHHA